MAAQWFWAAVGNPTHSDWKLKHWIQFIFHSPTLSQPCKFTLLFISKEIIWDLKVFSGNIISLIVILKSELGLKLSFKHLISQLCVLDTLCVVINILMFSGMSQLDQTHDMYWTLQIVGPFHSEHYRLQVYL